ncbi:MAG: hypothetical protein M1831_005008 [Alyxoria varia]|nr:MAG: hypothetical protein M1831_005008 [Alyxoria varia]
MAAISGAKGGGVVVSTGKMMKTVTVRLIKPEWNKHIRKYYYKPQNVLVNDPNNSLIEGDIVALARERHSRRVFHTVKSVIAPFSKPLDERPPILTEEQREQIQDEKRRQKVERRAMRGVSSAVEEAKRRGWGVGQMYEEANKEGHHVEREKTVEHGREVLPGGKHKFGKINEEAQRGKAKTMNRIEKGIRNEEEREKVEQER